MPKWDTLFCDHHGWPHDFSQRGARFFRSKTFFQEIGTNLKKKAQNSIKKGTKLNKNGTKLNKKVTKLKKKVTKLLLAPLVTALASINILTYLLTYFYRASFILYS